MNCPLHDGVKLDTKQLYPRKSPLEPNGVMFECSTCGLLMTVWLYANGHVQISLANLPEEGRKAIEEEFKDVFEKESALTECS